MDVIEKLLLTREDEGFTVFRIIDGDKETVCDVIKVIDTHKKLLKKYKNVKDSIKSSTNYVKEIPEFSLEITYIMGDEEKYIRYESKKTVVS